MSILYFNLSSKIYNILVIYNLTCNLINMNTPLDEVRIKNSDDKQDISAFYPLLITQIYYLGKKDVNRQRQKK